MGCIFQNGDSPEDTAPPPPLAGESETSPDGADEKPSSQETWTDVNLNDDSDAGRGEKPVQEISVVRVPAEYQPAHAVSRPDDLPIKVCIILCMGARARWLKKYDVNVH